MIRPRPIQGDGHVDFLGESEGSLPQPHDSLPDAGQAINDFWSMSGSFIPWGTKRLPKFENNFNLQSHEYEITGKIKMLSGSVTA